MQNLKNKLVLLTGASKGIGRQLALDLAQEGSKLGLVARSELELQKLQSKIETVGGEVMCFVGSVADETFVKSSVEAFVAQFGGVDYMINNAGYGMFGSTEEIKSEEWSTLFDTNVKGTFLFSQAVLPFMKIKKSGHIINIASDVAKRVFEGGALYCASKYAQDAFSAALRKEVRKAGIKVSVVYSGLVDTMFHALPQGHDEHSEWLKCSDMSASIRFIMEQPAHVVVDELMIHPLSQEY